MSEGRCGANISQVREAQPNSELDWLDKFENTCTLDAGHEGGHVFCGEDGQQVHLDDATKQVGVYQDEPAPERFTLSF